VTPKGDRPGFVAVLDNRTVAIPDRPGNNRLDTLENLLAEPSIGLLFLIPGMEETLRINGRAKITADDGLRARFEVDGKLRQTFCVNLFDAAESQTGLGEQPALKVGELEIAGKQQWETTQLEGWRPFLLVMLALLLVEWYIYGRRAGR